MDHMNMSDPESQYCKNSHLLERASSVDCELSEHHIYIHTYIAEFRAVGERKRNEFSLSDKRNLFWRCDEFRASLYDWLLGVTMELKLQKKIYFRALMTCDKYLLNHFQPIFNHHGDFPERMQFYLCSVALSCLFLVCKYEGKQYLPYQKFTQFLNCEHGSPEILVEFESDILQTIDYSLSFDTYIDVIDNEMVKNNYITEDFLMIKLFCEYILLRTVVVESEFLDIDIRLFCVSLLVYVITFIYDYSQKVFKNKKKAFQIAEFNRQKVLHLELIRKKTTFDTSVVYSVINRIKDKLNNFESDESYRERKNICQGINLEPIFSEDDDI